MRSRFKRGALLTVALILFIAVFLPGLPWSPRARHTLKRLAAKTQMKLAKWRGKEPRFLSIAGRVNAPGAQLDALDSHSGWATLSDLDGNFVLPDVMWYPGVTYELVISTDDSHGTLIKLNGPDQFPDNGLFNVGCLENDLGSQVELGSLIGLNSTTSEDFDWGNRQYYKDLFDAITEGKQSDEAKVLALNDYVASKLNYNETQWELGSPRRILDRGSEYCGHLSTAMETLLAVGGYQTRAVHMMDDKHPPNTHAVVEVYYGKSWHLYDSTFGLAFKNKDGEVASYEDVRLNPNLISAELFHKFDDRVRQQLLTLLPDIYRTGYHHFYYFKKQP
jgi:hypothetical protein